MDWNVKKSNQDTERTHLNRILAEIQAATGATGTVTSVDMSVPTGFNVGGNPITSAGTLTVTYAAGYLGYTTTEASKLSGIAPGATVGADWSINLTNIPANISSWAGIAPAAKQDALTNSTSNTISGTQVQRAALTGDVTAGANSNATTIANDAVNNAKLANMPANSLKGNNTGSPADPLDLTATQVRTLINVADGATVGATWGTNLSSIPANIISWAGIAPAAKQDALGYTPVNKAGDTMTGPLTGTTFRSTSDNITGFTGAGLEAYFNIAFDAGFLIAYNRTTAAWKPLHIYGNPITFYVDGTERATVQASGITVTGDLTAKGSVAAIFTEDRTNPANLCGLYRSGTMGRLWHSGTGDAFTFDTSGNCAAAGTLSDLRGDARDIPRVTGGLTPGCMYVVSAGFTINTGLAAGRTYSIYNDSGSAITLTQGSGLTLRLAGGTVFGNRTLAAHGIATFWCNSTTSYIMSGPGVT
jgi:hypothetical protein